MSGTNNFASRVALGTVQFGLDYGVANKTGQPDFEAVSAILNYATRIGVQTLDTAIAYGNSEAILGRYGAHTWQIVTKLPELDLKGTVHAEIQHHIESSLHRLRVSKLYGLMLHRPEQLLESGGDKIYKSLLEIKTQGLCEKIGVSIYGPDILDRLSQYFVFDLIQAPFNLIDRRLQTSGWLYRLHRQGVEVHTRSTFLQGVLLMNERPTFFDRWATLWNQLYAWQQEQYLTALQACLLCPLQTEGVDRYLVGVDTKKQLEEIVLAGETLPQVSIPDYLICEDLDLLEPSRWQIGA